MVRAFFTTYNASDRHISYSRNCKQGWVSQHYFIGSRCVGQPRGVKLHGLVERLTVRGTNSCCCGSKVSENKATQVQLTPLETKSRRHCCAHTEKSQDESRAKQDKQPASSVYQNKQQADKQANQRTNSQPAKQANKQPSKQAYKQTNKETGDTEK